MIVASGADHIQLDGTKPVNLFVKDTKIQDERSELEELSKRFNIPLLFDGPPRTEVLELDKKTKDYHVARNPELIRLTGTHPFNCEAPLTTLYNSGFLTPAELHYVRNHGPAPKVEDSEILDWEISIEGMVEKPYKLKLREIMETLDIFTTPVTLCCAGNRRKEQNMVKKGKGFNWGAAGVSTSLWTGPMLADIIAKALPSKKARFVWMEGGDDPAKGPYGTCIRLAWVMDPERSIMLAYKQNGQLLTPDHGRPLRVVIPGVIGGRSVKWLKKLVVMDRPSENWYHYFDNRVLPTMVTPEMAAADDSWWKDERYALYDLNVQSVTCKPECGETLIVDDKEQDFTIKGFAYNGGGVRVGRVEVSLDKGVTWRLAEIDYPEDRYREAGYFRMFGGLVNICDRLSCLCWCFWEIKFKTGELLDAKDIVVRAMDERMCVQPRNMYWNVTSMLNNWWYRVAIVKLEENVIKFEHPCRPTTNDGWMDRVKEEGGDILDNNWGEDVGDAEESHKRVLKPKVDEDLLLMCNPDKINNIITIKEFESHKDDAVNPWFEVKGHIFNGGEFLDEHPGGRESIINMAGEDATDDFLAIHSDSAKKLIQQWHLGKLETSGALDNAAAANVFKELTPTLLDTKKWKAIQLTEKEKISPDTVIFHFALEHKDQEVGLNVGNHIYLRLKDKEGKFVMRAYTPITSNRMKGTLGVLIKLYLPKGDFPGGKLTTLLNDLAIGSYAETKGPIGEFQYKGFGNCIYKKKEYKVKHFLQIAGGSGITPPFQIIQEVHYLITSGKSTEEPTMDLFFGNRTEADILCKAQLDAMQKDIGEDKFRINYNLSTLPEVCAPNYSTGRLSASDLAKYVEGYKPGEMMILLCGPPPMVKMVIDWAIETGFGEEYCVAF
ncbi:heme binding protein [[Candida] boidinii]|nr:heme binding protein [[Candida] boidinii]GMF98354.1 unnamed protein product [[Candida] boidinii]